MSFKVALGPLRKMTKEEGEDLRRKETFLTLAVENWPATTKNTDGTEQSLG